VNKKLFSSFWTFPKSLRKSSLLHTHRSSNKYSHLARHLSMTSTQIALVLRRRFRCLNEEILDGTSSTTWVTVMLAKKTICDLKLSRRYFEVCITCRPSSRIYSLFTPFYYNTFGIKFGSNTFDQIRKEYET